MYRVLYIAPACCARELSGVHDSDLQGTTSHLAWLLFDAQANPIDSLACTILHILEAEGIQLPRSFFT